MTVTTCTCGRVGTCATCCCSRWEHNAHPDRACPLCGHVGRVSRMDKIAARVPDDVEDYL